MAVSVEELLQNNPARLWRARAQGTDSSAPAGLPTGYEALDRCLPGQGWPRQGLIELLSDQRGIGELRLLMPALARLCSPPQRRTSQREKSTVHARGGWIAWVSPPYVPYAPALAGWGIDVARMLVVHAVGATEWAMDQALRSEACSAVLGWGNPRDPQALRRLQLAAEQSHSLAVLFRPLQAGLVPSPAVLRIALFGDAQQGLQARIVKSRGGRPATVSLGH
jgi:protein ImuA